MLRLGLVADYAPEGDDLYDMRSGMQVVKINGKKPAIYIQGILQVFPLKQYTL
jgi:hypothetical protein